MHNFSSVLLTVSLLLLGCLAKGQQKKVISHQDYDLWRTIKNEKLSNSGDYLLYNAVPLDGDATLYLYKAKSGVLDSIFRAEKASFSSSEQYVALHLKPSKDSVNRLRRDQVKKDNLPKDTLLIWNLNTNAQVKIPNLKSYKLPQKKGDWLAFEQYKSKGDKKDTITSNKKLKKSKSKKKQQTQLFAFNPITNDSVSFQNIKEYSFSDEGNVLAMLLESKDSINSSHFVVFYPQSKKVDTVFKSNAKLEKLSVDSNGNQFAFISKADSTHQKKNNLFYFHIKNNKVISSTIDSIAKSELCKENMYVSDKFAPYFSENGNRLFFGTVPELPQKEKDTLLPEEKVSVDIWHWKDKDIQPRQLKNLKKDKERTYTAVYLTKAKKTIQLATPDISTLQKDLKKEDKYILAFNDDSYRYLMQWEGREFKDVYLIELESGKRQKVLTKISEKPLLSPKQKYISYFSPDDASWYAYDIAKKRNLNLTAGIKDISFAKEDHDMPIVAPAYGRAGWTKNDKSFVVFDRYDLWLLSPDKKQNPKRLTKGYGRSHSLQLRFVRTDKESYVIPTDKMLLRSFNEKTKANAFYNCDEQGNVNKLISGDYLFDNLVKAKDSDVVIYTRQSFQEFPDLWISDLSFENPIKVSNVNPQQKDFNWGTVELVEWESFGGIPLEGLFYKPENFDPNKKYPMLVYFYETYSQRLHKHHFPKPSYSTINFPSYLSNGYLIFVPDIKYTEGNPGKDAYNSIISGVEHLASTRSYIDREHLGIQGQSWGGYQTAYLVTQTNIFAAAEAGAPVSNMTSAYGGIRWKSGLSRQFQYEKTQSRIGGTLWEKPMHYIKNSPLFFADQVNTPLMIMHNDNDGAVPWYQGIELFMALKRLQKPTWLINYNNAPHNLRRLADRRDLTIRLQQFFDFYLKHAPAPEWLQNGIPAVRKGKDFGFKLIKDSKEEIEK
ncbi:MAG: prolyl oligopeptidase family serine peptidase [Bacteroidales bacterium]